MLISGGHSLEDAYSRCERITGSQARNFSYGIRLLPPDKRRAMSAIYAMARRIDDIGDGDQTRSAKFEALAAARASLHEIFAGAPVPGEDPVLVALADAARRFALPLGAFDELVEGCEMDAAGTVYETFDDLVGYCRRVAGSVGRLSLGVFGCADPGIASPRADALGVALQVTNILRDLLEDRDVLGRMYLPREDLDRFGVGEDLAGSRDDLVALVVFEARRALPWWEEGLSLLPLLDRRSRACVGAMAGIYRRLFDSIQRQPAAVLSTRLSLPAWEKAWVATRALAGVGA